jgi:hypothetical protein
LNGTQNINFIGNVFPFLLPLERRKDFSENGKLG